MASRLAKGEIRATIPLSLAALGACLLFALVFAGASDPQKAFGAFLTTGIDATGGTITIVNNRKIHTFTSSGTFLVRGGRGNIEVLVVAGGGGGGAGNGGGGGGGAGGLVYQASRAMTAGSYTVTVGAGGTAAAATAGGDGGNSVFDTITALGGGGGSGNSSGSNPTGRNGGSAGGAGGGTASGGTATQGDSGGGTGYGNNGGAMVYGGCYVGGGGGGAGAAGADGTVSGAGGIGRQYSISGTLTYYAGGGGGGENAGGCAANAGGLGGGGNGGDVAEGSPGTANTGGGGGGGGNGHRSGGIGGSGIVIVSYPLSTSKASPTTGLVGWWTFDSADVTDKVYDRSGRGNHGYYYVSATSTAKVAGKVGQALNFIPYNSGVRVETTKASNISPTSVFTLAGWVKPASIGSGTNSRQPIIGQANELNTFEVSIGFPWTNNGKLALEVGKAGVQSQQLEAAATAVSGRWYHVVGVFRGGTAELYVDGVSQGTVVYNGTVNSASLNTGVWQIGEQTYAGSPNLGFNGVIDDARVYNRALSYAEIQQLYKSRQGIKTENSSQSQILFLQNGLVGHWRFNGPDMAGTTVYDKSGQGNNGTLTNGPKPALGKVGQALSFDGSDDYVYTTNSFNNPQDFTLSAWFKTTSASGKKIVGFEANQSGTAFVQHDRHIWMGTDGKVRIGWWSGSANIITSTNALNDGKWHHVVGTHNAQNVGVLYIDGVQQGTAGNSAENYTGYWRIGSYNINTPAWGSGSAGYFFGSIDEVRIYNRALSAAEVKLLYNLER